MMESIVLPKDRCVHAHVGKFEESMRYPFISIYIYIYGFMFHQATTLWEFLRCIMPFERTCKDRVTLPDLVQLA